MKWVYAAAFVMAAPAMAATAPASVPAQDQTAIRAFLDKLYLTYRNNDFRRNWHTIIGEANIFTPSTQALRAENTRLLGGGMGAIESDIFCACQDYDASFRLAAASFKPLSGGRVNATVVLMNHGRKSLNIQFEKTPTGWRVYDVELPQQGMLRKVLADENAGLI